MLAWGTAGAGAAAAARPRAPPRAGPAARDAVNDLLAAISAEGDVPPARAAGLIAACVSPAVAPPGESCGGGAEAMTLVYVAPVALNSVWCGAV